MWVGIACMSVCVPFSSDIAPKAKKRAPFNIVGSLIFVALYYALPKWVHPYIGIIGELVLVIQPAIHGRQFTIHLERCILHREFSV